MCGIIGYIRNSQIDDDDKLINSLINKIKHRGPDEDGKLISENVVLGHVRLSLVDLESGKQPIHYKNLSIVFNGEIYNYKELRKFLINNGYEFETTSDTEVVLKLFHFEGASFINKLNGIFAFCIIDEESNKLYFGKDYFGVKPLYIYQKGVHFVFSSEVKGIIQYLKDNSIEIRINNKAIAEYLLKGYVKENELFDGLKSLDSGSMYEYIIETRTISNLFRITVDSIKNKISKKELEQCLTNQINSELQADVDVGILLSGGVDSSLITSLASKSHEGLKTFSIAFNEKGKYDESKYAKIVSEKLNTEHKEYVFTEKDLLNHIDDLIKLMDSPIYDPAMLPMLFLAKNVKKEIKAVLSGDGGDEIFGGYTHYRVFKYKRVFSFINLVASKLGIVTNAINIIEYLINTLYSPKGPFSRKVNMINLKNESLEKFRNFRQLMRFDINNDLKYRLLVKTDLASMFYGLEIRVPFLSKEVYQKSLSISNNSMINLRYGKVILRKILRRFVGKDIAFKKKSGFRVPIKEWIKEGNFGDAVERDLIDNNYIPEEVISKENIEYLIKNRKKKDVSKELFSLFILNGWLKKTIYQHENFTN